MLEEVIDLERQNHEETTNHSKERSYTQAEQLGENSRKTKKKKQVSQEVRQNRNHARTGN